jgi:hypothetical protein
MKAGVVKEAERMALNQFDNWNDVAGFVEKHTGYYYEIQGVIGDAVHIGIQMALYSKVEFDEDKNVTHQSTK